MKEWSNKVKAALAPRWRVKYIKLIGVGRLVHKLGRESTIRTGLYLSLNYTNVNYMRIFRDEHGKSFKLGQLQAIKEESKTL